MKREYFISGTTLIKITAVLLLTGSYLLLLSLRHIYGLQDSEILYVVAHLESAALMLGMTILFTFVYMFAHELLHCLGFVVFGNASTHSIRFEKSWGGLGIHARTIRPVRLGSFRTALATPAVVMFLLCLAGQRIHSSPIWPCIFFISILSGVDDFAMLWKLRTESGKRYIVDDPDHAGIFKCVVFDKERRNDYFVNTLENL